MRIQVLSDLHIEFADYEVDTSNSDVVILAGDIHVKGKGIEWALENISHIPVIYVLGNHEFYGKTYPKLISSLKEKCTGTNIELLENDVFSIDGINFLGCTLWTDFELFGDPRITGYECQQVMTDFKKIRVLPNYSKIRSIDVAAIHRKSRNWLENELEKRQDEKNIVITHHAPSRESLPDHRQNDSISAAYASDLTYIMGKYGPQLWVHGHLHNSSNYLVGNCKVVCNPRGYPDESNDEFNSKLCFDVQNV